MKKAIKKLMNYACKLNNLILIKTREIEKEPESHVKFIALEHYLRLAKKTLNLLKAMEDLNLIYGTRTRWYINKKKQLNDYLNK